MAIARPELRRISTRVAINATLLVAAVYLLVSIAVVAYVTGSLTAQVDHRLTDTAQRFAGGHLPDNDEIPPRPGDRLLGRAFWGIGPDGSVVATDQPTLALPERYRSVTTPTTITIGGSELRIAGAAVGDSHVVVGELMDPVNDARSTIVLGELLIAPILLLVVFFGAIAIGRRVATPIELARQRQLDFTADASHELRTPLSVIEANASLALAQPRDEAWYRRGFEKVDAESKRMRALLEDLLWLARFDATQRPVNSEPVDLGVLAAQTADRFEPVAEAKRLSLTVRADGDGAVISAPPEWLDRLLGVLLDNACKYSPEGGTVAVAVAADSNRVALTVDDTGPGIPEAERERIFDRFHRATSGPAGAGLGLAIADAIVRATDGRWNVAAAPAGGARMSVTWPRVSPGGGRVPVSATRHAQG
ncbi:MAG TPA: HAMP domain-containing sensor histidine kinase [Candidatus Limnocylindrales bacterium]|nr:HAMP domain-containing sensor histidine kinase [Candidatus Limnocylindrales bacterium]